MIGRYRRTTLLDRMNRGGRIRIRLRSYGTLSPAGKPDAPKRTDFPLAA